MIRTFALVCLSLINFGWGLPRKRKIFVHTHDSTLHAWTMCVYVWKYECVTVFVCVKFCVNITFSDIYLTEAKCCTAYIIFNALPARDFILMSHLHSENILFIWFSFRSAFCTYMQKKKTRHSHKVRALNSVHFSFSVCHRRYVFFPFSIFLLRFFFLIGLNMYLIKSNSTWVFLFIFRLAKELFHFPNFIQYQNQIALGQWTHLCYIPSAKQSTMREETENGKYWQCCRVLLALSGNQMRSTVQHMIARRTAPWCFE